MFFPEVEKATGKKGIMDQNVDQHQIFLPAIKAWKNYIAECMKKEGPQKFDSTHFIKLIDRFAPQLVAHLTEEISTLLPLDKYDIAGVKRVWSSFDKYMQSKADVVCI